MFFFRSLPKSDSWRFASPRFQSPILSLSSTLTWRNQVIWKTSTSRGKSSSSPDSIGVNQPWQKKFYLVPRRNSRWPAKRREFSSCWPRKSGPPKKWAKPERVSSFFFVRGWNFSTCFVRGRRKILHGSRGEKSIVEGLLGSDGNFAVFFFSSCKVL